MTGAPATGTPRPGTSSTGTPSTGTSSTGTPPTGAARPEVVTLDVPALAARVRSRLAALRTHDDGARLLLGLAGAPGAGKSTLAAALVAALAAPTAAPTVAPEHPPAAASHGRDPCGSDGADDLPDPDDRCGEPRPAPVRAVVVPMDGFHLADAELVRLGRRDRKGAPDTFDADGYVALLARLRTARAEGRTVYAPEFRRAIEDAVAGAVRVGPEVDVVVTEGNYLLLGPEEDGGRWAPVRDLLDATWFVELPPAVRLDRLTARHAAHGKADDAARAWALGPDEANARLVASTRDRADVVVREDAG